jgi:DedD protein
VDTQLKHRLTGAVILVALIVLLVPEMLSGPRAPSGAADGEALSLPVSGTAPVAPVRSIDIDLAEPAQTTPSAKAASAPAPAGPPPGSPPAGAASSTPATAAARAGSGPPAQSAATPAPTRAPAGAAPAASMPRLPLTGRFVVQAGSFAARDSAESLAARLRREGFDVQVSAVQSGGRTLHRVRVGAATDRVAAEALLMRLRAAGHSGGVVAIQ